MVKRIILAVLMLLVVGGAVIQNIYVSGTTEDLTDSLKNIQAELERDDIPAASASADSFAADWEKHKSLFEALFEHKEVDSISATVKSVQSYCRSGAKDNALANASEALFYIEHIKDIDTFSWENVF